jgi:hypothetical protein
MRRRVMAKADIAALLALAAAFFIAVGDVVHHRTAHEVTDEQVGHLELFTRLLRDRQWWFGSGVSVLGFGLQAAALVALVAPGIRRSATTAEPNRLAERIFLHGRESDLGR